MKIDPLSLAVGAALTLSCLALTSFQGILQPQPACALTPEQKAVLDAMSIVYLDDGRGGQLETVRFTGVNVQIVSGLGATNGVPGSPYDFAGRTNGLGNLIVGYNEPRTALPFFAGTGDPFVVRPDERTGSHNVVTGFGQNYVGFGNLVGGNRNDVYTHFGGTLGANSCFLDGQYGSAAVSGGFHNVLGDAAGVLAGYGNTVDGLLSSVTGGYRNQALGHWSVVTGGWQNVAAAQRSVVSGGRSRATIDEFDWAAGTLYEDE